ncbi:thymidylate synthase [Vibrio sp. YT-16]|uniref:thymidylate synthase n=1 Tax=Vibrio sp. YT-16 TaxID=3074707 RepID=UPI002963E755|nr:thymidylate synthase [Vibrio sp. YT-16]MDW1463181.1 thymidylate synthase [Vibrio sp. YT-16]
MHVVYGETINDVIVKVLEKVLTEGVNVSTRNGDAVSLYDVSMILQNPRSRHLSLVGRKNNIFSTFAETMWVLAGDNRIKPYLTFFLPRAPEYSDDGITWRAAYGERLYAYRQLDNVIELFKEEGIFTRRAVISLYMPERDTRESLKTVYNLNNSLDIPCNNLIHFFITPDKKLNIKIIQRSGDLIFGVSNINIFEFSLLQEMVLYILQREVDSQLELGYLHQSVTNLHIYNNRLQQAKEIIRNKEQQITKQINNDKIEFPQSLSKTKNMFQEIVSFLEKKILAKPEDINNFSDAISEMKCIFNNHSLKTKENLLWGYAEATLSYIYQEKVNQPILLNTKFSDDFNLSVDSNHFNRMTKVSR